MLGVGVAGVVCYLVVDCSLLEGLISIYFFIIILSSASLFLCPREGWRLVSTATESSNLSLRCRLQKTSLGDWRDIAVWRMTDGGLFEAFFEYQRY